MRWVLPVLAGAALVAVTVALPAEELRWGTLLASTLTAALLTELGRRGALATDPLVAAVVGATAVVLPDAQAAWCAAAVAAHRLVGGQRRSWAALGGARLVLGNAAAVAVARLAASWEAGLGGAAVDVRPALWVGATLTVVWSASRLLARMVDQRRVDGPAGRWWLWDVGAAAAAVVLGVAWITYAPLALAVLLVALMGLRPDASVAGAGTAPAAAPLRAALSEELQRAARTGRPLALLVVDVDGMAAITQRWGRAAGDAVLAAVAERLRAAAREYDVVARVGPDAFAVLLPEVAPGEVRAVAERLRRRVTAEPVAVDDEIGTIPVRVSVGAACYPADGVDSEGLLAEAELAATYAALGGGDRVALAAHLPPGFHRAVDGGPRGQAVAARLAGGTDRAADPFPLTVAPAPWEHDRLVRAEAEPLSGPRAGTDRFLIGTVLLTMAVVVAGSLAWPGTIHGERLLVFAALAVVAEWVAESVHWRAQVSWAAVPLVGAALAGAPALEVALVAALAGIGGGVVRGVRARQGVFNTAVLVTSALAAHAAGQAVVAHGALAVLWRGLVGGAAFFAVDTWLVVAAVALASGTSVVTVWREDLAWLVPHQLGMGLLGGVMGWAYQQLGAAGALVLVVPAVALHMAQREFLTRTREHVVRLRQLNDDLQHANQRVIRVNERLTEALEQVNQGYLVTVESLAAAVDAKDSYTGSHIDRVEAYGRRMLEILDPDLRDDEALLWGFRLHDVGKIGIPDRILLKPGPLDDEEWEIMRRHPEIGAQIVAAAPFLQGARELILHHHERWDGRGYPAGLQGPAIPFSARVFAVIDAFDAMTSDRPYRPARPIEQAFEELIRHAGRQFDPEMVEAFLQIPVEDLERIRREVDSRREPAYARAGGLLIPIGGGLVARQAG